MKATAVAPSNIAFVKYWGKINDELTLPANSSISMNLAQLHTTTTVDFSDDYAEDLVEIQFFNEPLERVQGSKKQRVVDQLNRLRKLANTHMRARVRSINNFPAESGIASSASAFAALTTAASAALQLKVNTRELSILTRLGGSGSATRSIENGYVEWKKSDKSSKSYAVQLAPHNHWDLTDVILIVSTQSKKTSSLEGHGAAASSPFYQARLAELPARLKIIRKAILDKNITTLGIELEKEAISLHVAAMTSVPAILYWESSTISAIKDLYSLRESGIEAYFTMDAGPNVHVICETKNAHLVSDHFKKKAYVQSLFISRAGEGAKIIPNHLF